MKERPILFSTPMVQAILDGRKTITRRIVKQVDFLKAPDRFSFIGNSKDIDLPRPAVKYENPTFYGWHPVNNNGITYVLKCPYGEVGDRLWVRETWRKPITGNYEYFADYAPEFIKDLKRQGLIDGFKPSIHMPRAASRISLQIVSIKVELLQSISQEQAKCEGVYPSPHRCNGWEKPSNGFQDCYKCAFKLLWNQINGPRGLGWDKNPWVWVVEYKKMFQT